MKYVEKSVRALALVVGVCLITGLATAQDTGPQAGQKVAFLGDSITAFGTQPTGYVTLIAEAMEQNGRKIEVIPAGVGGNTSKDMLARLDKDVLSKKPDWMTLSCGVNDVWHGADGVPLDQYKQNITSIVDQATAKGIKVVLLTSTMLTENLAEPLNQKLAPYNDFLHALAAKDHLSIADLNADMRGALTQQKTENPGVQGNLLTVDGVHMNGLGNEMMAAGVLKAFGFTDVQLAQVKASWMDLPGAYMLTAKAPVSVRQFLQLRATAASQGKSIEDMLSPDLVQVVQNHLSAPAKP